MGKMIRWVGDFETSTGNDDGSTNVYLYGVKSTDKKRKYANVNLREFLDDLSYYHIRFVYFHNLSWDGNFILHHLIDEGYTPVNEQVAKHKLDNGEFSHLITDQNKIYKLVIRTMDGHLVEFGDTALLLPMKVSDMGRILKYPKGEIDYDKYKHFDHIDDVPKELMDYLWRDIDIVIDFLDGFKNVFDKPKMTIGSTALDDFKVHYGRLNYTRDFGGSYKSKSGTKKNEVLTKEMWLYYKQFYKGGFTGGVEKYRNVFLDAINGHSADIVSMYPGIMANHKLPYGKPLNYDPGGDRIMLLHIWIKKTWITDEEMPPHLHAPKARLNSKIKYVREGAKFFAFYMEEELDELKKTYELVEGINYNVIKRTWVRTKYTWRDWALKQGKLKTTAPNKVVETTVKLGMNSPYGKTGQKFRMGKSIMVFDPKKEIQGVRFGAKGEWVLDTEISESEDVSYILNALVITAYARILLLKAIRLNKKNILYWDTDSIYSKEEIIGIKYDQDTLGMWAPELKFNKFKWIKPKCYMAEVTHEWSKKKRAFVEEPHTKSAISGLPDDAQAKVTWEMFQSGNKLEGAKLQKQNVKGGVILTAINYTL